MATPNMLVQNLNLNVVQGGPGAARVNTFNPDGSVLDVSSGYTVKDLLCNPASQPNTDFGGTDISGSLTPAFDSTGVTLSWTKAQGNAISALLQSSQNKGALRLSNDGGTTFSFAAIGLVAIDTVNGMY